MMRKRRSTYKPYLENLEDRCCPSTYSVTDLGTLGGTSSTAAAINQSSQVVGSADTPQTTHAFLWQQGLMTDLGTLGGTKSAALALNNASQVQVVGDAGITGDSATHAFLWQNGSMTDLGTLGGTNSHARSLNNAGQVQVVGDSLTTNGSDDAFLWKNGVMTDLNNLLPASSGWHLSIAYGVNDNGQVVGWGTHNGYVHAFQFNLGTDAITNLGTLPGGKTSGAYALNNLDQVVGAAANASGFAHGFRWQNGVMTDLGTLKGYPFSYARSVNGSGQVVGYSITQPLPIYIYRAFLWQNGKITDINYLIASNSGWVLTTAFGINDTGCIVGQGTISNQQHAYLAIPPGMAPTTSTAPASTTGTTKTVVSSAGTPPAGIALDSVTVSQTLLPFQAPGSLATQPNNGSMPSAFASAVDSGIAGGGQVDQPAPAALGTSGHPLSPDVVDALFSDLDGSMHVLGLPQVGLAWELV